MTGIALVIVAVPFELTLLFEKRFMMAWAAFGCGLIGGFVSIQQRLNQVRDEELILLSSSWFQVVLIPIYGGIFALVLFVGFVSGLIDGGLFPHFTMPQFSANPDHLDLKRFLTSTYPSTPADTAKFFFWSFLAGFSERLVPQILDRSQGGAVVNPNP